MTTNNRSPYCDEWERAINKVLPTEELKTQYLAILISAGVRIIEFLCKSEDIIDVPPSIKYRAATIANAYQCIQAAAHEEDFTSQVEQLPYVENLGGQTEIDRLTFIVTHMYECLKSEGLIK